MLPLRILIADDQSDCRESLGRLLRLMGHRVWPMAGGEVVANVAAFIRPHLILVDIGMPGVDGYEVARRLRRKNHGACVVAISGLATENDKRKSLEVGFDDHIVKPVDVATLERLLDSIA
jgi:CheY-like chemotaxis protein